MKRNLLFLIFLSLFVLAPVGVLAQTPQKILKNATKALGKKKAMKAVNSWQKKGLIIRRKDGASGEILMQATKPDLYNATFDIRGFESEVGFNGRSGWIRDSREGLKTFTGDESDDFKAEVLYRNWRWVDYKKQKAKLRSEGQITLNGKAANVVVLTNPKGVPIKMYFDAKTNLLLREEIRAGEEFRTYDYSDYRPVNGVQEAFLVDTVINGEKYAIKFDQILHNVYIEQSEFSFPRISDQPLPDIPQLLKDLQANQDEIERILEDYSYKQQVVKRKLEKDGRLTVQESETVQLTFYKGYRIERVIAKNGKPLTANQQEDADEKAQKRVKEIEKLVAKEEREVAQNSDGTPDREGRRISIAEVLRASKLVNPRRERLKGRDVVVFDFEPNPNFDFKNAKSFLKFFGKTVGVMWIDEKDKQVARIEAVLADSFKIGGGLLAKLRKGASFTLEQERINNEIWLPTLADVNLSVRVLLFGGVKVNQEVKSFDYKKFKTEVLDAKVDEIKDQ
jgi:outer membrane lipoprotein-sorting protein